MTCLTYGDFTQIYEFQLFYTFAAEISRGPLNTHAAKLNTLRLLGINHKTMQTFGYNTCLSYVQFLYAFWIILLMGLTD